MKSITFFQDLAPLAPPFWVFIVFAVLAVGLWVAGDFLAGRETRWAQIIQPLFITVLVVTLASFALNRLRAGAIRRDHALTSILSGPFSTSVGVSPESVQLRSEPAGETIKVLGRDITLSPAESSTIELTKSEIIALAEYLKAKRPDLLAGDAKKGLLGTPVSR